MQANFKGKLRQTVERQVKIVKPNATAEEVENAVEGNAAIFKQEIVHQGPQHAAAKNALADIQDKHKDIMKLEKSIAELAQLFNDMAILVDQQGEMLDSIENCVNSAVSYVEKGVSELQKANKYQKKARNKMCCLIGLFLIIAIAIAVPVILTTSSKNKTNGTRA